MVSRRLLLLAPLGIVGLGGAAFLTVLNRMKAGKFDPHEVPSPLIGQRVPAFSLPGLGVAPGFSDADLARGGPPVLVNFFASWCVPCIEEHPVLMDMQKQGIPIWGIAYKDKPAATEAFIARHGDPYARIALDVPGRVAIDWGTTGVPETFLVDGHGIIRWHIALPISPETLERDVKPMLQTYA